MKSVCRKSAATLCQNDKQKMASQRASLHFLGNLCNTRSMGFADWSNRFPATRCLLYKYFRRHVFLSSQCNKMYKLIAYKYNLIS